ncbi:hypothetical protein HN873_026772, partial [Arachis hypogaea]
MSFIRSLTRRFKEQIYNNPSNSHTRSNILFEKVSQTEELSLKHNIFEEEVCFKDINQTIDNWKIPNIFHNELYVPEEIKCDSKSDYIIKTVENNILLRHESRCIQVAVKLLIREGLNASILMCLRDIRHNNFHYSLIGPVEISLGHGPVYFNYFFNKTV